MNKEQLQVVKEAIEKLPVTVDLMDVDAGYPAQWRLNPNMYWAPPLTMGASNVSNLTVAFSHFWHNRRDAILAFPMTLLVGAIRNSTFRNHTFGTINVDNTNDFVKLRLYRTLYVNYVRHGTTRHTAHWTCCSILCTRVLVVYSLSLLPSPNLLRVVTSTWYVHYSRRRSPATASRTTAATTCSTCA